MNSVLLRIVLATAFGGFLFGFDLAVIAGTTQSLVGQFNLDDWELGLTVSSAMWATAGGALLSGWLADRVGRVAGLRIAAVCFVLSGVGCAVAWNWPALLVFRALGGLAVGLATVICPMYIAEMSPARLRGRLVLIFQLNIVVGILLAYVSNALVTPLGLGVGEWRWKLGAEALPATMFLLGLLGLPPSPRWLAKRGRWAEAETVLTHIGEPEPAARLAEIRRTVVEQPTERLWQAKYRRPLLIGFALVFFNNTAGIAAVMNYLGDIFHYAGFSRTAGDLGAVFVGLMNLLCTIAALFLIDRLGRRTLLLIGAAGLVPCLAALAVIFQFQRGQHLLIWALAAYIAFFAISQGAVIWVYCSEIFPNRVRGRGEAAVSFSGMILGAVIAQLYPVLRAMSAALPFLFFAAMMVLQFWVVRRYFPETKGVSLEEMQRRLGISDEAPVATGALRP